MLTDAELSALRPPERLPVSAWIEANRVLHESYAAEPGPKKIDRTPFVKPILDAWLDPWVREIVVSKSAQIGLTDLAKKTGCRRKLARAVTLACAPIGANCFQAPLDKAAAAQ